MVLSSASPHLTIHGGDQRGCRPGGRLGLGEKRRLWRGDTLQTPFAPSQQRCQAPGSSSRGCRAQQMNPSGRCTVQPWLLPRAEVILEGILFIQEIFLEIFTCQDYMFKFFDQASSGPLVEFLKSFASRFFLQRQKALLPPHSGGGNNPFF